MLEQQDLQAIGTLLDQKFKENNKSLKDEIIAEIGEVFGESFGSLEARMDKLEEELAKRPTMDQIFSWADKRILELELRADRHDFMHIDELDKLPSQLEISKTLIERGFKVKMA